MKQKNKNPISEIFHFAGEEKKKMIGSTILSGFAAIFGIIPYIVIGKILILMLSFNTSMKQITLKSLVVAAALILEKIFSALSTRLSHKAAFGILCNIRCALTDKIQNASMGYIGEKTSGAYKETVIDQVDQLEEALAHMIPELIPNLILPLVVIVFLFILDFRIALVSMISIIIGIMAWKFMLGKDAMKIFKLTQEGNRAMNETIVEYIGGMEVIKSYNETASSMKNYEGAVTNYRDVLVNWYRHCHPYLSIYSVITPATICFELPVSGILLIHGSITLETFLMCMVLSLGIVAPLMKVITFSDHITEIGAANTRIQEILGAEEIFEADNHKQIADNRISLKNVSFGYGDTEILHGISFDVKPATTTAIVGASGSGKSTIAKLIARFWDVNDGKIEIGGVNIKEIPLKTLMNQISFVSQDNFLANTSIKENIKMGKPGASDEEVMLAARQACCEEFIARLPKGYDTNVGDAGSLLSGGERQRIAIARAIIKNSPIVILDEATAAIDSENEKKIGDAIRELTKGKTLVTIAHRLSTIKDSDQIIVMEKGNKIAGGTHEQLLKDCKVYETMWNNHIGAEGWSIKGEVIPC